MRRPFTAPDVHPGFIAAILPSLYPFRVSMDPTGRRKTPFPSCGSNSKSTQKRPSDRAKKYSWLREIDVLDYLAAQSEPNETPLCVPDGIKTRRRCFYVAIFAPLFYLYYKIIHLPHDIRESPSSSFERAKLFLLCLGIIKV